MFFLRFCTSLSCNHVLTAEEETDSLCCMLCYIQLQNYIKSTTTWKGNILTPVTLKLLNQSSNICKAGYICKKPATV